MLALPGSPEAVAPLVDDRQGTDPVPCAERVFSIAVAPAAWGRLAEEASLVAPGGVSPSELIGGLAAALSASPAAADLDATFVVRHGPRPAVGIVGTFTPRQIARIEVLAEGIERRLQETRYVGYGEAERVCSQLAARLTEELGEGGVADARFEAIPRGGHIVLGMLAMILGLRADQLHPPSGARGRTTVVVDDCALSGHRFGTWLAGSDTQEVVFATLFAPAPLLEAVVASEPRVRACVAGQELDDLGPERYGGDYAAWRERWQRLLDPPRYWIGDPEPVAFAWKEPDQSLRNPVTGEREPGWRLLPPALCLGNGDRVARRAPVQTQVAALGPLRPADDVIHAVHGGRTIVGAATSHAAIALDGVAADLWRALIERGSVTGIVDWMLARYEVDEARLRTDVEGFVTELTDRGLVVDGD